MIEGADNSFALVFAEATTLVSLFDESDVGLVRGSLRILHDLGFPFPLLPSQHFDQTLWRI